MTSRDKLSLRGQVALITGASRGIGRAIALEFARAGASLALLARSTDAAPARLPGTLEETARAVQSVGTPALVLPADVTSEEEIGGAVRQAVVAFGRIDVLVNNAAVFYHSMFHEIPLRRWELVMAVNLRGAVICSQAVLETMLQTGNGRIINVSSSVAAGLYPGMSPYAASKAGLETLTRYMAAELGPHGIAANVLRIDRAVATAGARLVNPIAELSDWSSSEDAASVALWLAGQPVSYTGRTVVMSKALKQLS
jgi:NAD(P)-dependent dehydrogenase (short-subunit alcohol dehydrogenase family)